MTSPAPSQPVSTRGIHWLWLVLLLLVGFGLGWCAHAMYYRTPPTGTCINPDTTNFATGITQQACTTGCPSCTWEQK